LVAIFTTGVYFHSPFEKFTGYRTSCFISGSTVGLLHLQYWELQAIW
jgi:hypothetical protein